MGHHDLDALHKAGVAALPHEWGEVAAALLEEGQELDGARAGLGGVDGGLELGQAHGREAGDDGLELLDGLAHQGAAALDLLAGTDAAAQEVAPRLVGCVLDDLVAAGVAGGIIGGAVLGTLIGAMCR